jgi:hypothetical protein
VEEGEWEVGKGEGDACGAGGDDIDAVTTVVGEGGAKIEGSVPVRVPREAVVGAVERKTKLAGGVDGVGGEVVGKTAETRPGREGRIGAPRAHNVEGQFSVGKEAVPQVSGKVGMGGSEGGDKMVLAGPH